MRIVTLLCLLLSCATALAQEQDQTQAQAQAQKQPNILFIMSDDVGWANVSAYHLGLMSSQTPHIDSIAADGLMMTDYYAQPTCGWSVLLPDWPIRGAYWTPYRGPAGWSNRPA